MKQPNRRKRFLGPMARKKGDLRMVRRMFLGKQAKGMGLVRLKPKKVEHSKRMGQEANSKRLDLVVDVHSYANLRADLSANEKFKRRPTMDFIGSFLKSKDGSRFFVSIRHMNSKGKYSQIRTYLEILDRELIKRIKEVYST